MRRSTGRIARAISSATALVSALLSSLPARAQMAESSVTTLLRADELEYGSNGADNPISWDLTAWAGGDWNRIWFKSEGAATTDKLALEGEAQLLYSRLVAPFWELQAGVRGDLAADRNDTAGRGLLVLGLEGLAPYWFELEPAIFVSHRGNISLRLRATLDLFVTQRLIAQPSVEANAAVQEVERFGVGTGFNDVETGLRLRYELVREFAPYIGISWRRSFAGTAALAEARGERKSDPQALAGLKIWF